MFIYSVKIEGLIVYQELSICDFDGTNAYTAKSIDIIICHNLESIKIWIARLPEVHVTYK